MTQENEAAEQQRESVELTPEQKMKASAQFRDAIIKSAVDNKLSFDVVFSALSQVAVNFLFDFNLVTKGELSDDNVTASVTRFNEQTAAFGKAALENLRERAKQEQEAAEAKAVTDVEAKPAKRRKAKAK